jgi:hypothetical protein
MRSAQNQIATAVADATAARMISSRSLIRSECGKARVSRPSPDPARNRYASERACNRTSKSSGSSLTSVKA